MHNNEISLYLNRTPFVDLPGLGISVELPRDVHLFVAGEVKDPLEFDAEFALKVRGLIADDRTMADRILNPLINRFLKWASVGQMRMRFPNAAEDSAHCFAHTLELPNTGRLFVISKRRGLERNMSLFADGHESGEFLQKIGRQDVLQKALEAERIPIDATQHTGEDFADLAGFLALHKAKKAGDETIRIPVFKSNREGRLNLGKLFGLEPLTP